MNEQQSLPFHCDTQKLNEYLLRATTIEDEQERLREETRLLREAYADHFPMKAVQAALKIARTRDKIINNAKAPMTLADFALVEAIVERHLLKQSLGMTDDATIAAMIAGERIE